MTGPQLQISFSADDPSGFTVDLSRVLEIITLDGPFKDGLAPDGSFRLRSRTVSVLTPEAFLRVPPPRPRKLVVFEVDHRLHGLPVWSAEPVRS